MSWAKHNIEKWDEICVSGIAEKIRLAVLDNCGTKIDPNDLDDIAHTLYHESDRDVCDALMKWAYAQVSSAESDHFSGLVDDAHERGKP